MVKNLLTVQNVAIIVLVLILWLQHSCGSHKENELRKEIIKSDSLKKELGGQYAKLVDDYNTERGLRKQLKNNNDSAYRLIRKNDEKILSLSKYVITLENRPPREVTVYKRDTSNVEINDWYPDSTNYFIHHYTLYNYKLFKATTSWDFKDLKINAILTETKLGIWNARLIGPDWFKVNDIEVHSLPPKEYSPEARKFMRPFIGLGVNYLIPNKTIGLQLNGGLDINDKWLLDGYISTQSIVGAGLNRKF